jgi:cyanophycin synthetase
MAGMDTGLGELGLWRKGVYNVSPHMEEEVGRYAAKAAVAICEALIAKLKICDPDIQEMRVEYITA